MKTGIIRLGLWLHSLITIAAGACFFLFPQIFGALWPWALPPLAARFMGSLLLGGGVCTVLAALATEPLPLAGTALLGLGDLLIASVGVLGIGDSGLSLRLIIWLVLFTGMGLFLWALFFVYGRQARPDNPQRRLSRGLRVYFWIHLAVVIPVGLTMYLAPGLAQKFWPWTMSPINIRLLGAFFAGASFLSAWSLRQVDWRAVQPLLALYAMFTSLATLASIMHNSLFNPARIVTWAFFALYIFVAGGAWFYLTRTMSRNDSPAAR